MTEEERFKLMTKIEQVIPVIGVVAGFINPSQMRVMADACRGEEREFFKSKILELFNTISTMPKSYQTDGQGDKAIAFLHYFKNGFDWYITELDKDEDGEGQIQAFGLVNMFETELGYINIEELRQNGVELDLHWTPKSLAEVRKELKD